MRIYKLAILSITISILLLLSSCHTSKNQTCITDTIPYTTVTLIFDTTEKAEKSTQSDYILNTNTHKFHYSDCYYVELMKESNKEYYTGNRDDIVSQGYKPCKKCNP